MNGGDTLILMNYDLQSSNFGASNVPNNTSPEIGLKRFGDKRISDLLVESRQANVHRQRVQEFVIEKLLFAGGMAAILFIALIFIFLFNINHPRCWLRDLSGRDCIR